MMKIKSCVWFFPFHSVNVSINTGALHYFSKFSSAYANGVTCGQELLHAMNSIYPL